MIIGTLNQRVPGPNFVRPVRTHYAGMGAFSILCESLDSVSAGKEAAFSPQSLQRKFPFPAPGRIPVQ